MEEKVIDLGAAKRSTELNEGFLEAFGYFAEMGLKRLFGYDLGLSDSRTLNNKGLLDKAVTKFQSATGLKWPFK